MREKAIAGLLALSLEARRGSSTSVLSVSETVGGRHLAAEVEGKKRLSTHADKLVAFLLSSEERAQLKRRQILAERLYYATLQQTEEDELIGAEKLLGKVEARGRSVPARYEAPRGMKRAAPDARDSGHRDWCPRRIGGDLTVYVSPKGRKSW